MNGLSLQLLEPTDPRAEELWRAHEAQTPLPYFLSWGWIENWLATLPASAAPTLASVLDDEGPAAAFFVGRRHVLRATGPSRVRFLNATGVPRFDELCIEHNAIACRPGFACSLARLVELMPDDWDELALPALSRDAFPGRALDEPLPHHQVIVEREVSSPYVDLERVRAAPGGYLDLLGSATRAQIRRAHRGYGALDVEISSDERHALDIYDELVKLHATLWRRRGEPGAFADPWFDAFHRRLIQSRHRHGELQLIRVRARDQTVGCLYNLVSNGRVLFYQSGLAMSDDPRLKPGYVCHAEAVQFNAAAGHAVYDFLGGDARYKQNLATDETRLVWAALRRPLARFALEDRMRELKRALTG